MSVVRAHRMPASVDESAASSWSEQRIAAALAHQVFIADSVVVVPNCNWTGHECDLLVVTRHLRVIDVEIKISRADLRSDARKDKWYHTWDWQTDGPWDGSQRGRPREWPRRVWKHYYAMPAAIWVPDLTDVLPSPRSGILLLRPSDTDHSGIKVDVHRRATPCPDAEPISPGAAIDIARLASLRMWSALLAASAPQTT